VAFADLLQLEGAVGYCWLVDVSFDDFATVTYRWSTSSYTDGSGNHYDGRIRTIGNINRSFGMDGFPATASTEMEIDNADFAVDWLVEDDTWTTYVPSARFRLFLALWDPAGVAVDAPNPTLTTQQMGEFVCMDFPRHDNATVKVSLADDSLGRIADLALAPSVNDWLDDADTNATNCPLVGSNPQQVGNWDAPIQLAFGNAQVRCNPVVGGYRSRPNGGGVFPIIVCATTDTDAGGDVPIGLVAQFKEVLTSGALAGSTLGIPATFWDDEAGATKTIWTQQRTDPISKDGKTWRIIWLEFNAENYVTWAKFAIPAMEGSALQDIMSIPQLVDTTLANTTGWQALGGASFPAYAWLAIECFWFSGYPLSARTSEAWYQTGPDVVRDLISYYSQGASSSDIDTTSFDTVKAALGNYFVGGTISSEAGLSAARGGIGTLERSSRSYGMNKLRQVLAEILGSIDADLSISWLGKYQLTALTNSFAEMTATLIDIPETRIADVERRTPSLGERYSPYNRLFVVAPNGETLGPFDHPTELAAWGRIFPRTVTAKWVVTSNMEGYWSYVWQRRLVEAKHRSLLKFAADIAALQLDLASYFTINWTRWQGGSTPYAAACFRVEGISLDPMSLNLEVEAVWMKDLLSEQPYLLDDETLVTVLSGSGGRTLAVTNGDQTMTFSSGNLVSDGVVAGDILLVHDAAAAPDDFSNDRATRITSVTDASHMEVAASDWTSRPGIVDWKILHGARTYPTAVTDAANYPSGGLMYGKTSTDADLFSDSTTANHLKGG
jgi:hypothetical protein